jgi:hypothetical protein
MKRNYGPVTDLHELQTRLLAMDICVNGCGPLTVSDSKNAHVARLVQV